MTAEINAPISTTVFGLPLRIWKPRPTLPPVKAWMIGLMMSLVNAAIRALNARATTSPTATTIMSPRIRKFLKPLIFLLRFADIRPAGRDARPPPAYSLPALPPAIAWRPGFWTRHTIPVPGWQCKRFGPAGRALGCGPAGRWWEGGERGGGRGGVGGRGEQRAGAGERDGPGVDAVAGLGGPGTGSTPGPSGSRA